MRISPHEKPSDELKALYKEYQKAALAAIDNDAGVVDFRRGLSNGQRRLFEELPFVSAAENERIAVGFCGSSTDTAARSRFSCKTLPGLSIIPSLLSFEMQQALLEKLLHRDMSDPQHKSNIHFHHDLRYPSKGRSFFNYSPNDDDKVVPKPGSGQKAMTMRKLLGRKLRWITLGGQYDWTNKVYPDEKPPAFPSDLQNLLRGLFPGTLAEAAILNFYSPGDVLSLHRDVSEYCDNGLISLSIGCDGLFIVALDADDTSEGQSLVIRLRSGDAVYMDGKSRFAWHGVPCVLAGTCPDELASWPAKANEHNNEMSDWKHWLASKRINLNVRQMWSQ